MRHTLVEVPGFEGLSQCTVCGGAEGELPRECPGYPMVRDLLDSVMAGEVDYVGGQWVEGPRPTDAARHRWLP